MSAYDARRVQSHFWKTFAPWRPNAKIENVPDLQAFHWPRLAYKTEKLGQFPPRGCCVDANQREILGHCLAACLRTKRGGYSPIFLVALRWKLSHIFCGHHVARKRTSPCSPPARGDKQQPVYFPNLDEYGKRRPIAGIVAFPLFALDASRASARNVVFQCIIENKLYVVHPVETSNAALLRRPGLRDHGDWHS